MAKATLNNITPSRRAILAGTAALPALAVPLAAATLHSKRHSRSQRLCVAIHTAMDEQEAFSARLREASERAEAACPPVPPEIARTALETNPDFAVLSERERDIGGWMSIPNWTIKSAISTVEHRGRCIIEEMPGCMVIRHYDSSLPLSPDKAAHVARLRALLAIADDHEENRNAAHAEYGALEGGEESELVDDRVNRLEGALIKARALSGADILAKLAVYNRRPDFFEGGGDGDLDLLGSIARDLPAVLGEHVPA